MANITVSATIADFMDSADATAARAAIAAGTVATEASTLALLAGATITPTALVIPQFGVSQVPDNRAIGLNQSGQLAVGNGVTIQGMAAYADDPMRVRVSKTLDDDDIDNGVSVIPFGTVPLTASQSAVGKTLLIEGTVHGKLASSATLIALRIAFEGITDPVSGMLLYLNKTDLMAFHNFSLLVPFTAAGAEITTDFDMVSNSWITKKAARTAGAPSQVWWGTDPDDLFFSGNNGNSAAANVLDVGLYVDSDGIASPGGMVVCMDLQFSVF